MVKLIVGKKGTGKTKMLIEQVNAAEKASNGCVICIEKGLTLNKDITHKVRLMDTDSYKISDAAALYGFIAGIAASNYDITDMFLDSTLRICGGIDALSELITKVEALAEAGKFNFTATVSAAPDEIPASLAKFI